MTNFEKLKTLESPKEMAKVLRRLYEEWLIFAFSFDSVEKGLIKWLESEVRK